MIKRRTLLKGAAAAAVPLASPALGQPASVLRVMPQAVLNTIDPVWSSAQIVRNLGFMVFETLYGRDENLVPHPQMLEELMAEFAVSPASTLMIGDTTHDLLMASNAGVDAVAVSYGAHPLAALEAVTPLYCAHSVLDLTAWLQVNV